MIKGCSRDISWQLGRLACVLHLSRFFCDCHSDGLAAEAFGREWRVGWWSTRVLNVRGKQMGRELNFQGCRQERLEIIRIKRRRSFERGPNGRFKNGTGNSDECLGGHDGS